MTTATSGAASSASSTDREALLHQAVQRSMVLRRVMRRAVQQIRSEAAACSTESGGPISDARDARPEIGQAQFVVLYILAEADALSVGEIAERCHVAVPTVSRMLNNLEVHGLIERHIDPTNRRSIRVVVTEAGRVAHAQMTRRFEAALEHVLSPLTDAELADLITAFGHLEHLVATEESTP